MFNPSVRALSLVAAATLGISAAAQAVVTDVQSFLVTKGVWYKQYSPAAPVLIPKPYHFFSSVELYYDGGATNVSLRLPNGQVRKLNDFGDVFEYQKFATTKALLDTEFPMGRYGFTIDGPLGRKTPSLTLGADAYPPVPRISNWSDAQTVEDGLPVTLLWSPFTGGTTNDFIFFEVSDTAHSRIVYSSPGLLEGGALNGTNTQFTIPGGTLEAGTNFIGRLLFVKKTGVNTSVPAAIGAVGYNRETEFPIVTQPAAPAEGRYQFATSSFSVKETNSVASIVVSRSGGTGDGEVFVTATGGTASNPADYSFSSASVYFNEGSTIGVAQIPLSDDFLREGNETVLLSLNSPSGGAAIGARSNVVLTILDNEIAAAGVLQFKLARTSLSETSRVANILVTRTGGVAGTVSARYAAIGNTAAEGQDLVPTNGVVTFGPGQTNKTISVKLLNDTIDEVNETFTVSLSALTGGASLGPIKTHTVTIVDEDLPGTIAFRSATYSVNENGTNAVVSVSRTGGKASGVSVNYSSLPGTATDADFAGVAGTIDFGFGETNKTFLVPITQDFLAEGNEAFTVHLANATGGAKLGTITNATVNLVDDESSLSFSSATYLISETNKTAAIVVTRSGSLTTPVSVDFATTAGTAIDGGDFTNTTGVLSFPVNTASKTIHVPLRRDFDVEDDDVFTIALSNPQGGTQLGTITQATVTIKNDDFPGVVSFSARSYSATEGGAGTITVKRTGMANGVTVQFNTTTGTATAGTDFNAVATTLTFAGGESSKVVKITTKTDITPESTENVGLVLSNVSGGATLGTVATATLNIANKPDPNAIPAAGETYMTATITGVGHSLFKTLNVKNNPLAQETVAGGYSKSIKAIQGLTGSKTTVNGFQVTTHTLQLPFMVAPGPTVVTVGGSSTSGGAVWTFTTFGGESHSYGTGSALASGKVILDVVNPTAKILAGRFDFIAVESKSSSTKKVRIQGSFRLNNVSVF